MPVIHAEMASIVSQKLFAHFLEVFPGHFDRTTAIDIRFSCRPFLGIS